MRHLLFVGPHLSRRHPGWVTTQSEILADLFRDDGWPVRETSSTRLPMLRVADMLRRLATWRRWTDVAIVSVFSGRAFRVAEVVSWWASRLGVPQIHVLRGGGLPQLIEAAPERVCGVLRRATVVSPSAWLAEAVAGLGIEARVIPNVLDLSRYDYLERSTFADPAAPRLLWMRTFHHVYHPQLALRTLARLHADGLDASLTMAGQDKGLLRPCRELASQLGVAERVRFVGFLDPAGKRSAFARHDVFLNTNRVDNTPVTVLEAMASGMPVVATSVGGVPHVLEHGSSGRLVADGDAQTTAVKLAGEVNTLVQGGGRTTVLDLSRRGRRVAEGCAWPAVRASWQELLADLG
ncbi:MAG: glycosyltransferase [Thermoanaerobaculia bacterium]|nr:glycosyltransferase [Thermoanaerobaculia bacterium]